MIDTLATDNDYLNSFFRTAGWGLMTLLSVGVGIYAILLVTFMGAGQPEIVDRMPVIGTAHFFFSGLALILGPFQFLERWRRQKPLFHRRLGQIYVISVVLGGLAGLLMAPSSPSGLLVGQAGFAMLAVIWLYSGIMAYLCAHRRDFASHRQWMIRNFSLTFAAVTLRVYLGLFAISGVSFADSYPLVAWLSWVPNLVLVEWWMNHRAHRRIGAQAG